MNTDHDKVAAELEKCRRGGLLKPEDVVRRAQNAKSVLHDKFTWDNTEAGHQYRLLQARNLIRVYVVQAVGDGENLPVYVSLTTDRSQSGGGYRTVADVMNDETLYRQMLQDATVQLRNMQMKYKRIRELDRVWVEVEKLPQDAKDEAA